MAAADVREMAEDLVEDLEAMGRLPEAATLAREYLKDDERAVVLLTQVCCAYADSASAKASGLVTTQSHSTWPQMTGVCRRQLSPQCITHVSLPSIVGPDRHLKCTKCTTVHVWHSTPRAGPCMQSSSTLAQTGTGPDLRPACKHRGRRCLL